MKKKKTLDKTIVGFVPLGCPKNIIDSEKMLAAIAQAGFAITADHDNADAVVINTCGFIAPAKEEAFSAIKHAISQKKKGKIKKIIVVGCLAERLGKDLFNQLDGIDTVAGLAHRDDIASIIKKTMTRKNEPLFYENQPLKPADDTGRLLITPPHSPYLRISEGCNHKCAFCTIPAIRGPFHSKQPQNILAEARELVAAGAVELNIIGQDITYYGRDLNIKNGLPALLTEIEQIPDLRWIRLLYLYPIGITPQLISTIAESKKIVHYIDLPIQHINDRILKDMRRPDTSKSISLLIQNLRTAIPDVILRTTVIVGLPGETQQEFDQLLIFINETRFDCLGAFKYYREHGTLAAEMPNQVPDPVKQNRLEQVMLAQQKIAFEKNINRIGSTLNCLVDSIEPPTLAHGRFYGQAPDIDSICLIRSCKSAPGLFIDVKVSAVQDYDLIVDQI